MSAYSYHQHPPFLLDSVFYHNGSNSPIKASSTGFLEDHQGSVEAPCFSQFYPPTHEQPSMHQEIQDMLPVVDGKIHESNTSLEPQLCSHTIANGALSDNELSALTNKKQSTDSSSVLQLDKLESGEQVTQMLTASMEKKKNRDASSLTSNSFPSKDARDVEIKKQKKSNGLMKDEEKKSKSDKKDPKKGAEEPPKGYIHVRARRGQATDSHSLAERVRREKISERMKLLQSLVPGCDKVTGKALMLDEIINYVQSLQNQVEFLSMKLASVNPMFYNFGMDLETFMVRPERLNTMASPLPSVQQCSSTQPTAFADTAATFSTANTYPLLDTSTSLLLQQGQRPTAFIQDNGNLLWDVDDQRQKLYNQSGFNTNLCSFH